MSVEATHWVYTRNRVSRGNDRLVLLALANEADSGTGYCFPSVALLAFHTLADRTTVMDAIVRLEQDGQLLVKRPETRGRGHHNEYVVVMDRDPYQLADLRGWSRPPLSPAAAARRATALDEPSTDVPSSTLPSVPSLTTTERPVAHPDVPSSTLPSVPSLTTTDVPSSTTTSVPPLDLTLGNHTEVVHSPTEERSETPTIPARETVGERSPNGRQMVAPEATIPVPNPNPRQRVQDRAILPVDNMPGPVRQLAEAMATAGQIVTWNLDRRQTALVEAQLRLCPVEALVDAALLEVARKGPPRSARAWVDTWVSLVPPPADLGPREAPWCGDCDPIGRQVEDEHGRWSNCKRCHPNCKRCHPNCKRCHPTLARLADF